MGGAEESETSFSAPLTGCASDDLTHPDNIAILALISFLIDDFPADPAGRG